jgi:hypothetical protein
VISDGVSFDMDMTFSAYRVWLKSAWEDLG